MRKRGSPPKSPAKPRAKSSPGGITLGRERFARISAIEGIVLTPAMKKRAADAERRGLSGDERRRVITEAYRKD